MNDDRWYTMVAGFIALTVVVSFVAGLGLEGSFAAPPSGPAAGSVPTAHLYFTVTTSAATDYDTYYPANVTLVLGQPVDITITCYDPGVNNVSALYQRVIGTVGGTANYTYGLNGSPQVMSSLPSANLSHTFTVSLPGEAGTLQTDSGTPFVNVPVPVSPDGILPATVTFSVVFSVAGDYVWRCVAPCDPYSMVTPGFMNGSISVS